jgi:exopolysaccharide biosynthesis protein
MDPTLKTTGQEIISLNKRKVMYPRPLWIRIVWYSLITLVLFSSLSIALLFLTPLGASWRYTMADTLISTQNYRQWAVYLIGHEGLRHRVEQYQNQFDHMGDEQQVITIENDKQNQEFYSDSEIEIEKIDRTTFKGYILYVRDPKKVKIVVPNRVGKGEKVSSMVKRTNAIAGVNAGGFADPQWKGNGFVPIGLVMSGGEIFYNNGSKTSPQHIVGIDKEGKMIAGKYSIEDLYKMNVQEAVTFSPRFIVNGKGLVKNQADGWGIAPRTAMAQKKDGTIMFIVVDGRQKHSIGASLYDLQEILLEREAIIAANLDGGSSTVMVHNNQILNSPASPYGERYIPSAWLVFKNPQEIQVANIWEGLDPEKIDASKW